MAEKEKLLTRYLIFEADAAGVVLNRVGEKLANGAEEALRKFYAEPPADHDGFSVAVSENNFKLRKAKARVTTSLEEVEWPNLGGEEVAEVPESARQPGPLQRQEEAAEEQEALV